MNSIVFLEECFSPLAGQLRPQPYRTFAYMWFLVLCSYGTSVFANLCICICICFLCFFFGLLFFCLFCLVLVRFVGFLSNYYYFRFLMRNSRKGCGLGGGRGGEIWEELGKGNYENILYDKTLAGCACLLHVCRSKTFCLLKAKQLFHSYKPFCHV